MHAGQPGSDVFRSHLTHLPAIADTTENNEDEEVSDSDGVCSGLGWVPDTGSLPCTASCNLPGKYCHCPQFTGEAWVSNWFRLTHCWVMVPGSPWAPVPPSACALPCVCPLTHRPSPWVFLVGTIWPSILWPHNTHEDHLGCWKTTCFKMEIPGPLPGGSSYRRLLYTQTWVPSPLSRHVDPLAPSRVSHGDRALECPPISCHGPLLPFQPL